jgi:hypothetical protein
VEKCKLDGKTPNNTVRTSLDRCPKFVRVDEGVYGLQKWPNYAKSLFAKHIGYEILKRNGHPMNVSELGEQILHKRTFIGSARQIARGVIRSDKRFYYDDETDMVGLEEWLSFGEKGFK